MESLLGQSQCFNLSGFCSNPTWTYPLLFNKEKKKILILTWQTLERIQHLNASDLNLLRLYAIMLEKVQKNVIEQIST